MKRVGYDFVGDKKGLEVLKNFTDEELRDLIAEVQRTGNATFGDGINAYKLTESEKWASTLEVDEE